MSRTVAERLLQVVKKIDRPGSFCVSGGGPAPLPGPEVAELGLVGLPLTDAQAKELKKRCRQAPYGKGEETVVDTSVRQVWQLAPDRFSLTNPEWESFLAASVQTVQQQLGLEDQKLQSHLYNLLLYEPGSFFLPHRDGEKLDRMVATLVVVLPSAFKGGELVVHHEGLEQVVDFSTTGHNPFHTHFAAFYADCEHEVRPLKEGHRLCLVYNLTLAKAKKVPTAPRTTGQVDEIGTILQSWSATDPVKLAIPLEHQYTEDGLVWDALKGVDRVKARVLAEAASRASCRAYLALLTFWESASVEDDYEPRSRSRWHHDENVDGKYEIGEIIESTLTAQHWSDAAGNRPALGEMEVEPDEIVPPEALTKVKPQQNVSGYTGNEGLTLERWYRHAVIVLWPESHHFSVLCDSGVGAATVGLQEFVGRWQKARKADAAALKVQCLDFAGQIIARWGARGDTRNPGTDQQLLAALVELDDTGLVGQFLIQVVAKSPSIELNESFAELCDKHGWTVFAKELGIVFDGTAVESLERTVRLLDLLCTAKARQKEARLAVCKPLAEKAVASLVSLDVAALSDHWRFSRLQRPALLAGLVRSLAATEQSALLSGVLTHALGTTKLYPLPIHIAALRMLENWLKKHLEKPPEAVAWWLAACCTQLESLTTVEPQPPTTFAREANVSCTCSLCKELVTFLKDPVERVHRFRVRQDLRNHLDRSIGSDGCDVGTVLDRTGSPQTLVCTKNTASYEANLKKYREDKEHLATLRSIEANLPK